MQVRNRPYQLLQRVFVLFDNVAFNVTRVEEETSNGCGLSVVDVTNKYDVTVWLASVFPL